MPTKYYAKKLPRRIVTDRDACDFYIWLSDAYTSNQPLKPAKLRRMKTLAAEAACKLRDAAYEIEDTATSLAQDNQRTDRA